VTQPLVIRAYEDPQQFVREVAAPMAADAITNNVFLIVADQMAASPEQGQLRYGAFRDDACVLAAWMTPPFRLGLADLGQGEAAAAALAESLAAARVPLPGVVGPKRLAETFARAWGAPVDHHHSLDQTFYRIHRVKDPRGVPGSIRLARHDERELLCDWLIQMGEDSGVHPSESSRDAVEPRLNRAMAGNCAYVWDDGGKPVSCALERPFRTIGARITTVFTARGLRGRGYGGAITAALSRRILESGRWCVLFADAGNPATNRLYQSLGYQLQAVYSDIHFVQD
jgi:hypothetical protein